MKTCELHEGVQHREEPHPLAQINPRYRGRIHSYCPECRKEAKANVAETAHLTDGDIKAQAARERIAAGKPMRIKAGKGIPGGQYVLQGGILVPRLHLGA